MSFLSKSVLDPQPIFFARILYSPDSHLTLSKIVYLRRCQHIYVYIVLISDLLSALISNTQVREYNEKKVYNVSGNHQQKIRKKTALMFYPVASSRRPIPERNDFQIHFALQQCNHVPSLTKYVYFTRKWGNFVPSLTQHEILEMCS